MRRLFLGLTTITGIARKGYFIPYSLASSVPLAAARAGYPVHEIVFAENEDVFVHFAERMAHFWPELKHAAEGPVPAPRLGQNWFPPFDALAAYAMVREFRPQMILEIGGGHSTRIFAQASDENGCTARLTVIDPQPRRALDLLARAGRVDLRPCPLQAIDPCDLPALRAGDVLSLDGSHILMPGSDTDIVLNRILPALPEGVLVHCHDIFLPDPYPESWAWRGYNEQQGVAALLAGGTADILFSSHYITTRLPALAHCAGLSGVPGTQAPPSSLWLRWKG